MGMTSKGNLIEEEINQVAQVSSNIAKDSSCASGCCSADKPSAAAVATADSSCASGCCSSQSNSNGLSAEDTMEIDNITSESECLWIIKVDELENGMTEDAKAILNLLRDIDGVLAASVNM